MIWKWKWWCFVRLPFYHLAVLRLFVRRCLLIVTRTQISSPDDNWQWKLNLLRPTSQERLSFYLSILCSLRLCFTHQIRSKNPLQINNINKISFFFSIIPSDGRIRSVCSSQSSPRTGHFIFCDIFCWSELSCEGRLWEVRISSCRVTDKCWY